MTMVRYDVDSTVVGNLEPMIASADGDYVTYADHVKALATLEAECRWAMERVLIERETGLRLLYPKYNEEKMKKCIAEHMAHNVECQRATAWLAANPGKEKDERNISSSTEPSN